MFLDQGFPIIFYFPFHSFTKYLLFFQAAIQLTGLIFIKTHCVSVVFPVSALVEAYFI